MLPLNSRAPVHRRPAPMNELPHSTLHGPGRCTGPRQLGLYGWPRVLGQRLDPLGKRSSDRMRRDLLHIFGWSIKKGHGEHTTFKRHGQTVIPLESRSSGHAYDDSIRARRHVCLPTLGGT